MGQDMTKAATDMAEKIKDKPSKGNTGRPEARVGEHGSGDSTGPTMSGRHRCECPPGNCCRGTSRPDDTAADKADGLAEEKMEKKGDTSGGKEPETPEETLKFLRQFVDQG